jgi:hypothetical protein
MTERTIEKSSVGFDGTCRPGCPCGGPVRDPRLEAVAHLLTALYLYDGDIRGRGARGRIFDAIKTLSPLIAESLDETNDPRAVLEKHLPEYLE